MSDRRVVCPGCSCLCDGLKKTAGSNLPDEILACSVGSAWFANRSQAAGKAQVPDAAKLRKLLEQSSSPLITGIENLTTEEQQSVVKVADRYFAGIDTGWSNSGRGSMAAFQRHGKVTATLGEISHRSDLVLLWFCDPQTTHPRFVERFVRPKGKQQKRLIAIDQYKTATAEIADEFIQLDKSDAFHFVQQLRLSLAQGESQSNLLQRLVSASYGSLILGKPTGVDANFDIVTDQWFQLVRSLNDHTRFVMSSLRDDRNGIGANHVLTSMCGFPDAVRFTQAGPQWNGLEYATVSIIERRECDLLVVCDLGTVGTFEESFSAETIAWLKTIPVVVLSDMAANRYATADVHLPVGTPGWTASGDFVRSDNVPIPMSPMSGVEITSTLDLFRELLAS